MSKIVSMKCMLENKQTKKQTNKNKNKKQNKTKKQKQKIFNHDLSEVDIHFIELILHLKECSEN